MVEGLGSRTVSIKIDGAQLSNDEYRISDLVLDQPLDGHHRFTMEVRSFASSSAGDRGASESLAKLHKKLGAEIEIEASHASQGSRAGGLKFVGILTNVEAVHHFEDGAAVRLEGASPTIRLDDVPRNRIYEEMSVSDWFNSVLGERGLQGDIDSTSYQFVALVQRGETDFEMGRRLFAQAGLQLFYDGEKICAKNAFDESGITLGFEGTGGQLYDFGISMNAQPGSYQMRAWPSNANSVLQKTTDQGSTRASASHPFAKAGEKASQSLYAVTGDIEPEVSAGEQALLDADAGAHKGAWMASLATGHGSSDTFGLKPGIVVKIEGLGDDQNGDYLLTSVRHKFAGGRQHYRNEFTCCPVGSYSAPRETRTAQTHELWHATVTDLNDPEGFGRVKVAFLNYVEGEIWARIAMPHLGSGGGWLAYPEIGDEVLVAFTDGDHRYPVIIGSLMQPATMGEAFGRVQDGLTSNENNIKTFITRQGSRIEFDDTSDSEMIEIALPGDVAIVRLKNDGGDAVIQIVSDAKIEIESKDSCVVNATGDITVDAGGNAEIKAGGDAKVEATGALTLKGGMEVKIEGGMSVEMKGGSGTVKCTPAGVEIKGPIIQLN